MHKFMMAAVVAGATIANLGAVESQIVGYTQREIQDGFQMITGSFLGMGTEGKFKLTDIKLMGYEDQFEETSDDFNFCRITPGGSSLRSKGDYFYWEDAGEGAYWCDAGGAKVDADNDYEFDVMEAFLFSSPNKEDPSYHFYFQSAGQVNPSDCTFNLVDGFNIVGNPYPYEISLTKVSVGGYEDQFDETSDDFNFCKITAGGSSLRSKGDYFYWEDAGEGAYWCDAGGAKVDADNDFMIGVGEGFLFSSPAREDPSYQFTLDFEAKAL